MAWIGKTRALRARLTLTCFALALAAALAPAQLRVVTTIPDFADVARQIGGERVVAESLTGGREDLHFVNIRPSLVIKLRRADVFVQMGLDAEHAWVPAMMRTARNAKVQPGAKGFCDASRGVRPLQVLRSTTRDQGPDVHPRGNPHYNLAPENMRVAARNIRDVLTRVAPEHAAEFRARHAKWEKQLDARIEAWNAKLAPLRGASFVEAHSAWVYFAKAFDLRIVARLEPKPGLAPTPSHLAKVMRSAREGGAKLVVGRTRFLDVAKRVAAGTGGKAVVLPICSSSAHGPDCGWFCFMDRVVDTFAKHLQKPVANERTERKRKA